MSDMRSSRMVGRRSTDAELNTILLDTLAVSKLRAYQTLYQQYCNRSSTGITYEDLYNNIHDLVKYDGDGIKSITARDSDMDDSDGSRITKESSRSSNSHSSRRNQQIAAAANYIAQQQVGVNTAANANIRYQSPGKSGGHSSSPGQVHARTAKALSTPSSGAPLLSATTQLRQVVQGRRRAQSPLRARTWIL